MATAKTNANANANAKMTKKSQDKTHKKKPRTKRKKSTKNKRSGPMPTNKKIKEDAGGPVDEKGNPFPIDNPEGGDPICPGGYKIDYDFDLSIITEDSIEDAKQRLFTLPLGEEVGNYFLEQLSMGLMGNMLKRFILALGESNAGKSLISKALGNACGEYVGSFNAESLAYTKSDADEASKMRWLHLLSNKRLIFSNELKMNVEINGNTIKKLSSGGDTLVGRQHNCAETQFKCLPLAVVFANDIPKIKPYDTALDNRIRVVSYNKKFVEEPTKSDELKADPEIENEIKTLQFKMSLVMLLLKTYVDIRDNGAMKEPEVVKAAKKEWLDEEPDMIKSLLESYEFTDNKDDFIMSTELQDWVNGKNISITKLGREINKYADINKYENIKVIVKKVEGKCVRVWTGIKSI